MNAQNLEFLTNGLKYMGFGDKLNAELEKQITNQPTEFNLNLQGEFKRDGVTEKVDYRLDFKKSDKTDMYFFNRYHATLKNDDPSLEKSQTFYVTKNSGITAKEAYNMLSGRSVNKDLTNKDNQPYNAWVQLDFSEKDKNDNFKLKQFTQGYGFDLEGTVNKYPIKELGNNDDKVKLLKSLEKGNLQPVTFIKEGREEKMFVSANPQYKTLDLYDSKMQKQFQGVEKKQEKDTEKSPEKKETKKQEVDEEGEGKKEKRTRRGKGVGV
jgi:hypothetical protein